MNNQEKIHCYKTPLGTWIIDCPDFDIAGRIHQWERDSFPRALMVIQGRVKLVEDMMRLEKREQYLREQRRRNRERHQRSRYGR